MIFRVEPIPAFRGRRDEHQHPCLPRRHLQKPRRAGSESRRVLGSRPYPLPSSARAFDAAAGLGQVTLGADRIEHQELRVVGADGLGGGGEEGRELVGPGAPTLRPCCRMISASVGRRLSAAKRAGVSPTSPRASLGQSTPATMRPQR